MYHGLQNPSITGKLLSECDRAIRRTTKRILHISDHTGNQMLHAKLCDGGLGIPHLRSAIPQILLRRLQRLSDVDGTTTAILVSEPSSNFLARVTRLAPEGNPEAKWREDVRTSPLSRGLEAAAEDNSSRSWLMNVPIGWSGRDFVRSVQLRTGNLPVKGLQYAPAHDRRCRAGCPRVESLCHVMQGCKLNHFGRIERHNEIVRKVAHHTRSKGWTTEVEPRVRHPDGQLYIPDLAIHQPNNKLIICDAQVCWEGPRSLAESWVRKRLVYDHAKFRDAALTRWPNKTITCLPLLLGARGIWPRANDPTTQALNLPPHLRSSCVHSCLKWGSTLHQRFMAGVWRRRPPRNPPGDARPPV